MKHCRSVISYVAICCIIMFLTSCHHGPDISGTYREVSPMNEDFSLSLELKPDGNGVWSAGDDVVDFKWEVRNDELWLHTKSGGIITGRLQNNKFIDISLPGVGNFFLEKTF